MKTGVITVPLYDMDLKSALAYLKSKGVEAVEIGVGGFPGNKHCDAEKLLKNEAAMKEFKKIVAQSGLEISGFACHGNPVHPNKDIADTADRDYSLAIAMCAEMNVDKLVTFSGCPGDGPSAIYPNWVTCPWPEDFLSILDYQWNEVLIPYWTQAVKRAQIHGIKVCLEMHPGFCVYNPETLLKLRAAVGPTIGANFDPSHLFWQGIDPAAAIRALGDALYYVHAKDVKIDVINTAKCGVLDTKHYSEIPKRSWVFKTVGYGHGREVWCDMISQLQSVGFDGTLSIEHEDGSMSIREGLEKAIAFINDVKVSKSPSAMWWA